MIGIDPTGLLYSEPGGAPAWRSPAASPSPVLRYAHSASLWTSAHEDLAVASKNSGRSRSHTVVWGQQRQPRSARLLEGLNTPEALGNCCSVDHCGGFGPVRRAAPNSRGSGPLSRPSDDMPSRHSPALTPVIPEHLRVDQRASTAFAGGLEPSWTRAALTVSGGRNSAFAAWSTAEWHPEGNTRLHSGPSNQSTQMHHQAADADPSPRESLLSRQLKEARVVNNILMQEVSLKAQLLQETHSRTDSSALAQPATDHTQGMATAMAALQQVVDGKDAEIADLKADLKAQVESAVEAEKARWASTFNALVTSVKEPFQRLQQTVSRQEEELRELRSLASTATTRGAHQADTTSVSTPPPEVLSPHQLSRSHAQPHQRPQHRIPQHLHPQQQLHVRARLHARPHDARRTPPGDQTTPASSPRPQSMDTGAAVTPRSATAVQVNGKGMSVSPFAMQSVVPMSEGGGFSEEDDSAKGGG
ncbi:hypothetical protein WJX73_001556 [Symbiochloris irregularis]|uniref:Uncharacterized protein n=1 Tax=Symbiochloris irregularis TaxID=706552 RepID=A0AAW1PVX9_9CHLO